MQIHDGAWMAQSQQPRARPITAELIAVEDDARAKVRLHGNTSTAARWADVAIVAMRRRFRHIEGCQHCLEFEAISGGSGR